MSMAYKQYFITSFPVKYFRVRISFVSLTNLYFRIPKVVQQRNYDVVESNICTLLEISLAFQQLKIVKIY